MIVGISIRSDYLENQTRQYCNETYIKWLTSYGFNTLLINDSTPLTLVLNYCDMLIISGGYDIHPSFYNQKEDKEYPHYNKQLDMFDFTLLKAFHKAHKPVLGICRGLQIINVYFHGTLFQNIKNHSKTSHSILFHKDSLLYPYYADSYICNSYHHQSIDILGKYLKIEAISTDGIIEAISFENYIIGVQWHPERMEKDPILSYFLQYLKSTSKMNIQ